MIIVGVANLVLTVACIVGLFFNFNASSTLGTTANVTMQNTVIGICLGLLVVSFGWSLLSLPFACKPMALVNIAVCLLIFFLFIFIVLK